jgi:hypothetical protein
MRTTLTLLSVLMYYVGVFLTLYGIASILHMLYKALGL